MPSGMATGAGPASRRKRRASAFSWSRSIRKSQSSIITRQGILGMCLQRKAPCNWTKLFVLSLHGRWSDDTQQDPHLTD